MSKKYTYNGITFNKVDLSTYSNIGAKIKNHGINEDGILDNKDLSDFFVVDSIFIDWNGAYIPSVLSKNTYTYINCTSDLLNYIISLCNKINDLSDKLDDYELNKNYSIVINTEYLNYSYSGDLQINISSTEGNPKIITFTPYSYFNLPSSLNISGCSYYYNNGILKLYNPINNIIIEGNGIAKNYNINFNTYNNNVQYICDNTSLTYLSSNVELTINSLNDYKINNIEIVGCKYNKILNNEYSYKYTLSNATSDITINPKIYKNYNINGNIENCTINTNNLKIFYNEETLNNEISITPNSGYILTLDDITIEGASKIKYENNILTINNVTNNIILSGTAKKEQILNKYIFIGIDIYNDDNTYKYIPTSDTLYKIINNEYLSNINNTTFNDEYIEMLKFYTFINNLLILPDDISKLSNPSYLYSNILFDVTNINETINISSKKLVINWGLLKNNIDYPYIAIPDEYNVNMFDDLNSNKIINNIINTFSYDNINYNVYKLNMTNINAIQANITISK